MNAPPNRLLRIAGWCVHAYTASGLLCATAILLLLLQPERTPDTYRYCFWWMLLAVFIDATDGTLARAVKIKETIPSFDGRRLDDLVDYLLYTCLPLLLLYRANVLPPSYEWLLIVALFASTYGFAQADIKTTDGAFLGFPSYWNIIAFYFYTVPIDGDGAAMLVVLFSVLTFVPSKYPYPTQRGMVNRVMLLLAAMWGLVLVVALFETWQPDPPRRLILGTMLYPVVYLGYSWIRSLSLVLRGRHHTVFAE